MMALCEPLEGARFAQWIDRQRASARLKPAPVPGMKRELAKGLIRWTTFQL